MNMQDLYEAALQESRNHIQTVMATVVHVEGHAYRKEGVSMILTGDGRHYGTISPGCLEDDLCGRVEQVWNDQGVCVVEYDMRPADDFSWGENIGCGGLLKILLEPVRGELQMILETIHNHLNQGEAVRLTRSFQENGDRIHYELVSAISASDSAAVEAAASSSSITSIPTSSVDQSRALMLAHSRLYNDFSRLSRPDHLPSYVFVRTYRPKPRLILIGAGDDAMMVSKLAQSAGFQVVVGDWREALCSSVRFPGARLAAGFPQALYEQIQPGQGDYILLMSHNFPREREWIELLDRCPYTYLGIMGSRERTRRLMDGLKVYPNLHSPVGLSIGADGPDEIAISIAAELIAVKRDAYISEKEGAAHELRCSSARSW